MSAEDAKRRSSLIAHRSALISGTLLFLLLRAALLFWRQPFFDELFTVWIAAKPFAGIVEALRFDSGPPLYYFVVHGMFLRGVLAARLLSLACAGVTFILLRSRTTAAFIYAVFPPAVLFAVDARSYAMCAMFITIGVLALHRDRSGVAAAHASDKSLAARTPRKNIPCTTK